MTFAVRQINLQFTSANGNTLNLEGLRCSAVITNPGGSNAFGQLQLQVYGMTLDQMNQYSSTGSNMVAVQNQSVTVSAGNKGQSLVQVFSGTLISSFIDLSGLPEVGFVCAAVAGYYNKAAPAAANTYEGSQNAEDIIKSLTNLLGSQYTFSNPNGAHAVLQNQYVSGSIIDQMQTVARAAAFPMAIENNTVTIWPNNGTRLMLVARRFARLCGGGMPLYSQSWHLSGNGHDAMRLWRHLRDPGLDGGLAREVPSHHWTTRSVCRIECGHAQAKSPENGAEVGPRDENRACFGVQPASGPRECATSPEAEHRRDQGRADEVRSAEADRGQPVRGGHRRQRHSGGRSRDGLGAHQHRAFRARGERCHRLRHRGQQDRGELGVG